MSNPIDPTYQDILNKRNQATEVAFKSGDGARTTSNSSRENYNSNSELTPETAEIAENLSNYPREQFSQPREVFKDKKIKRLKDISRLSEENNGLPSASIGEVTSFPNTSPEGLEAARDGEGVVAAPAATTTSSRAYQGISVQHSRTRQGVKLFVTLQTPRDADEGVWAQLTAELKHRSRLREIRAKEFDGVHFSEVVSQAREFCQTNGDNWYMGRLHLRKVRSQWLPNSLVLGRMTESGGVDLVKLLLLDELYEFPLAQELSRQQAEYFHTAGIWGELRRTQPVPTLDTAPRTRAY